MTGQAVELRTVCTLHGVLRAERQDSIAVEEPLEIRLAHGGLPGAEPLSITMRTPGDDLNLAAGFLYGEGLIRHRGDLTGVQHTGQSGNVVRVDTAAQAPHPGARNARNFYASSSCGVCGKASIEAVTSLLPIQAVGGAGQVSAQVLGELPERLHAAQTVFHRSGGLHGVGLFDLQGRLLDLKEDVGRHNALDKLVGQALRDGALPWQDRVLLLSGRASFELIQKAMAAGASIVAAIGAPSTLAIDLAAAAGVTLVGFLKAESLNVYTGAQRIA